MEQADEYVEMVPVSELGRYAGSKKEFYTALSLGLKIYLPPLSACSFRFMKQLTSGEKAHLRKKKDGVVMVDVPNYPEISLAAVLYSVMNDPYVRQFLPDTDDSTLIHLPRKFVFNVINSLKPGYFDAIIRDS